RRRRPSIAVEADTAAEADTAVGRRAEPRSPMVVALAGPSYQRAALRRDRLRCIAAACIAARPSCEEDQRSERRTLSSAILATPVLTTRLATPVLTRLVTTVLTTRIARTTHSVRM